MENDKNYLVRVYSSVQLPFVNRRGPILTPFFVKGSILNIWKAYGIQFDIVQNKPEQVKKEEPKIEEKKEVKVETKVDEKPVVKEEEPKVEEKKEVKVEAPVEKEEKKEEPPKVEEKKTDDDEEILNIKPVTRKRKK